MIINSSQIDKVNFEEILEENIESLTYNLDKTKTVIKWNEDLIPSFLHLLTETSGPYSFEEITEIINTEEWSLNHVLVQEPIQEFIIPRDPNGEY